MIYGNEDGFLMDDHAGIFLFYVIDGIVDRCFANNRHLNTISIRNNAVHSK